MTELHIREGGCQCGAVRYRAAGAPHIALACHCPARKDACFPDGMAIFEQAAPSP